MEIRICKKEGCVAHTCIHVHVHVTHLVMLYDIQNARTQLSTITTTVLHGPVHVGLGALAYVMVNKVLINVLAQSKYKYMYMHIHLSERSLNHLVPSHFAAPWAIFFMAFATFFVPSHEKSILIVFRYYITSYTYHAKCHMN